jgi:hypothetical protein
MKRTLRKRLEKLGRLKNLSLIGNIEVMAFGEPDTLSPRVSSPLIVRYRGIFQVQRTDSAERTYVVALEGSGKERYDFVGRICRLHNDVNSDPRKCCAYFESLSAKITISEAGR